MVTNCIGRIGQENQYPPPPDPYSPPICARIGKAWVVTVLIAGLAEARKPLVAEIGRNGASAEAFGATDPGSESPADLAAALLEAEREIDRLRPERVVLADDSDFALAAALVAAKLLVPVEAARPAIEAPSANGRLIAQLAGTYTPPG